MSQDRAEWVDPVPARRARGDMFHLLLRPPPSERPPVPAQLFTPADGSGSQPLPGWPLWVCESASPQQPPHHLLGKLAIGQGNMSVSISIPGLPTTGS